MNNLTNKTSLTATITVTFYFGPSDDPYDTLKKKYAVRNWDTEATLREILEGVAQEMNYISGYGILSIRVQTNREVR